MSGVASGSSGGSGGGSALNYTLTKFTSSGTWNKLSNTKSITIFAWNAGSGGGSGRQGASTSSGGGGGGSSGGGILYNVTADMVNASETITVGAGGSGGASRATINTSGAAGSLGGISSFGSNILFDPGPQNSGVGIGGLTTTAAGGSQTVTLITRDNFFVYGTNSILNPLAGNSGQGSNVAGENATQSPSTVAVNTVTPAGCGGGGGGADSVVIRSGGLGGQIARIGQTAVDTLQSSLTAYIAGGTAGIESGTINGGNGNPATNATNTGRVTGGSGGGGGGGQSAGAAAGNGGTGGAPGGGGGGGGGSLNGTNSGAGGTGGRGEVWVFEFQ